MGFEKFRSCLGMESKALKQSDNETDSVRAGKFEIGRRRKLAVNFDDLLEKNGDGAYAVPE